METLPREVILAIVDLLDPSSFCAFRLTCWSTLGVCNARQEEMKTRTERKLSLPFGGYSSVLPNGEKHGPYLSVTEEWVVEKMCLLERQCLRTGIFRYGRALSKKLEFKKTGKQDAYNGWKARWHRQDTSVKLIGYDVAKRNLRGVEE